MSYARDNIRRMSGYTPGFQPREPGFVKLNTNENPYAPSPRAVEAMREACGESIRKYPDPLADRFREAAAKLHGVDPQQVLCGFGSDDLLTIAVRTFCGEGDTLAFPRPSYSLYEVLAQIQGAQPKGVEFPEDYSMPPGLADAGAALTMLPNPNAPSATMLPPEAVEQLARALDGVLLVDEAYVDFADRDCVGVMKSCSNVVVTRTFSKSYSLAGLRFGYALASAKLVAEMVKVKDSYNVSAPAIAGATAAIEDQAHLEQNVTRIRATRARLIEALDGLGCRCRPSQANFVLARVPDGRGAQDVFNRLFERKILVRYFDLPRLDDCLRITVGTDEQIDTLLGALGEILA